MNKEDTEAFLLYHHKTKVIGANWDQKEFYRMYYEAGLKRGRDNAIVEELLDALETYSHEDRVLGGSDYQMHGTSSSRQAFDDGGRLAREILEKYRK